MLVTSDIFLFVFKDFTSVIDVRNSRGIASELTQSTSAFVVIFLTNTRNLMVEGLLCLVTRVNANRLRLCHQDLKMLVNFGFNVVEILMLVRIDVNVAVNMHMMFMTQL